MFCPWLCLKIIFYLYIAQDLFKIECFENSCNLKAFITFLIFKNWSIWSIYCVKRVRIRSYSGPHFSCIFPHSHWIERDTPYLPVFSPNAGKSGRNLDQNKITNFFFFASPSKSMIITIKTVYASVCKISKKSQSCMEL